MTNKPIFGTEKDFDMLPLQLEVGKYYRNRNGEKIKIVESNNSEIYPYKGCDSNWYRGSGEYSFIGENNNLDLIEEWKDEETSAAPIETKLIKSDGGSTSYYELPTDAKELQDIIEAKNMSFARGEAFKALYRLGEKDGTDPLYDINKIEYFAARMKARILKGEKP